MSDTATPASYRVLLVTDAYPPLIGGADRAVQLLAYALRDRGHTVAVATASQPGLPAREDDQGVPVHRLRDLSSRARFLSENPNKHSPAPFPDPEAVWRFRRLIASFQPDVVHSYGWITYSCAAALAFTGIPLVLSTRDYANTCAVRTLMDHQREICSGPAIGKCLSCSVDFYGPAKGLVASAGVLGSRRLLLGRLSGLHYNSSYMRQVMRRDLLRRGAPGAPDTLPEATVGSFRDDSQDAEPDEQILSRLPDRPFILFVGALRKVKGVELLLRAYRELREPPPLVLIGTQEIDTPAEIPPGVVVLRSVAHGTVMAAWERALFGVFPSIWPEPFGNVVHEAMSKGRAVIGTAPGGHADMIANEENGLLVAAGSQSGLRSAMQRLIDDRELRERLGSAAGQRGDRFTAESAMPRLLSLYQQAILTRQGRRRPFRAPAGASPTRAISKSASPGPGTQPDPVDTHEQRVPRVCVVGSGTRFLSGISYHTNRLSREIATRHRTSVILMRQLLPSRLYPGRARVGEALAELAYPPEVAVLDGVDWFWGVSIVRALIFLRSQRPDLIVFQWWSGTVLHSYLALALMARLIGAKIVIEYHEVLDTGELAIAPARWYVARLAPLLFGLADGEVFHNEFDRSALREHYDLARRPSRVVALGPFDQYLDVAAGPAREADRRQAEEPCELLFFGVIRPFKGLEDLIEAFELLTDADAARFRLTIVGETWEGWSRPAEMIAASPRRDSISFVNRYVSDAEAARFFAGADAVVLPYHRSSASGPLHLAMAHGLPVVVTAVGGLVEAAAGYRGAITVPPRDPAAIARALLELHALRGQRFQAVHTWESTLARYEGLFQEVIQTTGSRAPAPLLVPVSGVARKSRLLTAWRSRRRAGDRR